MNGSIVLFILAIAGIIIYVGVKLEKEMGKDVQPSQDVDDDLYEDYYDEDDEIEQESIDERYENIVKEQESQSVYEQWLKSTQNPVEQMFSAKDYDSGLLTEYEANRSVKQSEPTKYEENKDDKIPEPQQLEKVNLGIDFDARKAIIYSEILKNKYIDVK